MTRPSSRCTDLPCARPQHQHCRAIGCTCPCHLPKRPDATTTEDHA